MHECFAEAIPIDIILWRRSAFIKTAPSCHAEENKQTKPVASSQRVALNFLPIIVGNKHHLASNKEKVADKCCAMYVAYGLTYAP